MRAFQALRLALAALLLHACLAVAQVPPSDGYTPTFDMSGTLADILKNKAATQEQLQKERQAELDNAAKVAAELAKQVAWTPPKVTQPGKANYVDASKPETPDPEEKAFIYDSATAKYPRMPSFKVPVPQVLSSFACPLNKSVKRYKASNDADAIMAANNNPANEYIYFPPGTYKISKSITISKPIVAGALAQLNVDKGVTLTITQRPHKWDANNALFGGEGSVKMAGAADEVHPSWFRSGPNVDATAIQKAIDSCVGSCTLMITNTYYLTKAIYLKPNVGVFSTSNAQLIGLPQGSGEGIVLRPGKYGRLLSFGNVWSFSKFAIKIQGGVSDAEIQINSIIACNDGIVFAPDEGNQRIITNVFVTHLTSSTVTQSTVVFRAQAATNTLQNCLVRGNFVVSPGHNAPSVQSASLVVRGAAAPKLIGTTVEFQAVEASQFAKATTFSMLLSEVKNQPVNNVVFKVAAWGGGLDSGGKVVSGYFGNLRLLARMSGGVSRQWNTAKGSKSNRVTLASVASAGAEYPLLTTPNAAAFAGGQAMDDQVFYVNAAVTTPWPAGVERTFYAYSNYAGSAAGRIKCLPFRAVNAGLVCSGSENQHATEPGRVMIKLKNMSAGPLPDWFTSHRFGLQVGP